jgi:hypothetical protein
MKRDKHFFELEIGYDRYLTTASTRASAPPKNLTIDQLLANMRAAADDYFTTPPEDKPWFPGAISGPCIPGLRPFANIPLYINECLDSIIYVAPMPLRETKDLMFVPEMWRTGYVTGSTSSYGAAYAVHLAEAYRPEGVPRL